MDIFKSLLNRKSDLTVILKGLENLLKNQEDKESSPSYYSVKGGLLNISKRQLQFNLKRVEDLAIPDLESLIKIILHFKIEHNPLKEELNHLLDEKFQIICSPCLLIRVEYRSFYRFNPYLSPRCDYENLFHYISAKEKLGRLNELKNDEKLAFILKKTYELEKPNWFEEKYLRPRQNKWVHFVSAINKIGILNYEEVKKILKHNAELKINKKLSLLAQFWNRVWLFRGLGIKDIEGLKTIFPNEQEFIKAKKNICSFFPVTFNFEKEDVFAEGDNIMYTKYLLIKNFCHVK